VSRETLIDSIAELKAKLVRFVLYEAEQNSDPDAEARLSQELREVISAAVAKAVEDKLGAPAKEMATLRSDNASAQDKIAQLKKDIDELGILLKPIADELRRLQGIEPKPAPALAVAPAPPAPPAPVPDPASGPAIPVQKSGRVDIRGVLRKFGRSDGDVIPLSDGTSGVHRQRRVAWSRVAAAAVLVLGVLAIGYFFITSGHGRHSLTGEQVASLEKAIGQAKPALGALGSSPQMTGLVAHESGGVQPTDFSTIPAADRAELHRLAQTVLDRLTPLDTAFAGSAYDSLSIVRFSSGQEMDTRKTLKQGRDVLESLLAQTAPLPANANADAIDNSSAGNFTGYTYNGDAPGSSMTEVSDARNDLVSLLDALAVEARKEGPDGR
jgi:hypothetical protein